MRILGIFRGFPGLGRVVSGVGILETLREKYNCEVEIISYLQGKDYLALTGDYKMPEVTSFDYCSIGLLPTNRMGLYIHERIKQIRPDIVLIDGEMDLGKFGHIYFVDFDQTRGRERQVQVQIIGE